MTGRDPRYGAEVRRRFETLPGAGELPRSADVVTARAGDRELGAEVVLGLRVESGRAAEVRFRAFGCPHFVAAASWITDCLRGGAREDFANWDWRDAAVALEVPPAKFGRLLTLQDAVRELARNWPGGELPNV
jgi:NifU-like protein involved in Fe-S cluster formation